MKKPTIIEITSKRMNTRPIIRISILILLILLKLVWISFDKKKIDKRSDEQSKKAKIDIKVFNLNVIKSIKDKNDNMNDTTTMKLIPINRILVIALTLGEILIIVRPQ